MRSLAVTAVFVGIVLSNTGCRSTSGRLASRPAPTTASTESIKTVAYRPTEAESTNADPAEATAAVGSRPAGEPATTPSRLPAPVGNAEEVAPSVPTPSFGGDQSTLRLSQVVDSTRVNFPLVRSAVLGRVVASGETLSAFGAFDRKLDGYHNIQPQDFYENHWYKWSLKRDTMWGGQIGAGYRLGRGSFEPWYKERETNDGGELGFSVRAPIIRDIFIDANRAQLWRAQLEQQRIEPVIRGELILAVRNASAAYWEWVAAGALVEVAEGILRLGVNRQSFIETRVARGAEAEIDETDNQREVVKRRAKLIDAQRKLGQASAKLALFLRNSGGQPIVLPPETMPPDFPESIKPDASLFETDVEFAIATRPELAELAIIRRQLGVDLRQARNELCPDVDGGLFLGQDVGNPTSSDDKSEFEVEATLTVSVPLERRKARGKVRQVRGKLSQLAAKTQFARDKVGAEVRVARTALLAAAERVEQTREGVRLAMEMQAAAKRFFELGQEKRGTLFELNLREQQAAEAAAELVSAQLSFFVALADYTAALGLDEQVLGDEIVGDDPPIEPGPVGQGPVEPAPADDQP